MSVDSLPKTVTRQRRDCDFNQSPSAPESSTLTTRLPSHPNGKTTSANETSYTLPVFSGRKQNKLATSDRWGGQIYKIFMSNFLRM